MLYFTKGRRFFEVECLIADCHSPETSPTYNYILL